MTMPLDYGYQETSPDPSAYTVSGLAVIGLAGAVSSYDGMGIASVVKAGTGLYTITFEESWNSLLEVRAFITKAGGAGGLSLCLTAEAVGTAGGGTVTLGVEDITGTLINPVSLTIRFGFRLERESVG